MDELLHEILEELKEIKSNQAATNVKLNDLDELKHSLELTNTRLDGLTHSQELTNTQLDGLTHSQELTNTRLDGLTHSQELMGIQLHEHGSILSSLQKASEFHKADIDNLRHQIAALSAQMKSGFRDILETQKSLLEMYGEHEAEIRKLKRKPV
ncbi:MAG TPA: hypothetical protein VN580_07000 [Clostridia bacterium]|nr:hypothetical protein [Clostridia bacterium]